MTVLRSNQLVEILLSETYTCDLKDKIKECLFEKSIKYNTLVAFKLDEEAKEITLITASEIKDPLSSCLTVSVIYAMLWPREVAELISLEARHKALFLAHLTGYYNGL